MDLKRVTIVKDENDLQRFSLSLAKAKSGTKIAGNLCHRKGFSCQKINLVCIAGVDLEHLPESLQGMHTMPHLCQILQIAFHDHCYLFDLQRLDSSMDERIVSFFRERSIIKVGMGFDDDLRKLRKDFPPPCMFPHQPLLSYAELIPVRPRLMVYLEKKQSPPENKTAGSKKNGKYKKKKEGGLAGLVRLCLGVGLHKEEQVSNWSLRPLRDSQLHYAALDAHCQLLISDWLKTNTELKLNATDLNT